MVSSLSVEMWAEILHFLAPEDMASVVSSSLLMEASADVSERAAWLALGSRFQKAASIIMDMPALVSELEGKRHSMSPVVPPVPWNVLTTYQDHQDNDNDDDKCRETFLELYTLFMQLLNAAWEEVEPAVSANTEGDDIQQKFAATTMRAMAACNAFWLLFGAEPPKPLEAKLAASKAALDAVLGWACEAHAKLLPVVAKQLVARFSEEHDMQGETNNLLLLGMSPARVLQIVLRLGDAGQWKHASAILSLAKDSFSQLSTILATDTKILGCKFIIDRMYASTYVNSSDEDSQNLLDAVILGREAVQQSLQLLETAMTEDTNNTLATRDDDEDLSLPVGGSAPPSKLPASLHSLFPNPMLRLAAARLALARALASMGQHVGLKATDPSRYTVPLVVARGDDNNHNVSLERAVAESLFQEGLQVIQSSLTDLESVQVDNQDTDVDVLEVQAATIAARGELLYCAASAHTRGVFEIRDDDDDGAVMSMDRLLQKSMASLTQSFRLVGTEFGTRLKENCVSAWCAHAPHSLMVLQCQTAKDLGKVCDFAQDLQSYGFLRGSVVNRHEAGHFLTFAYVVSLRLYEKSHPSVANIQRLLEGLEYRNDLDPTTVDEASVNAWLLEVFGESPEV
jgi:hypothetical protein